jgi:hypothetical protein
MPETSSRPIPGFLVRAGKPMPREPSSDMPPQAAARRGRAFRALQVAAGGACLIGCFIGASLLLAASDSQEAGIKLGRIEQWPEIKDGVPEVVQATAPAPGPWLPSSATAVAAPPAPSEPPVRDLSARPTETATPAPPPAPAPPTSPQPPERAAAARPDADAVLAQLRASARPPPVELNPQEFARETTAAEPSEGTPTETVAAISGSPESPDADAGETGAAAGPAPTVAPLPPRRPKSMGAEPRPKPAERRTVASAGDSAPAEARAASPAPAVAESAPAANQDERVRLFGMAMPAFIPNERKIKNCLLEFRC